jgi:heme/copper-type cytochrome/quinol oxidase subunit 2
MLNFRSAFFAALVLILAIAVFPAVAQVPDGGAAGDGLKPLAKEDCGFLGIFCFAEAGANDLVNFILAVLNVILVIAGVVALIYLIIGGVRYIVSQGDSEAAQKAKNTILYAVIGLIVIGISAVTVNFVLNAIGAAGDAVGGAAGGGVGGAAGNP